MSDKNQWFEDSLEGARLNGNSQMITEVKQILWMAGELGASFYTYSYYGGLDHLNFYFSDKDKVQFRCKCNLTSIRLGFKNITRSKLIIIKDNIYRKSSVQLDASKVQDFK